MRRFAWSLQKFAQTMRCGVEAACACERVIESAEQGFVTLSERPVGAEADPCAADHPFAILAEDGFVARVSGASAIGSGLRQAQASYVLSLVHNENEKRRPIGP